MRLRSRGLVFSCTAVLPSWENVWVITSSQTNPRHVAVLLITIILSFGIIIPVLPRSCSHSPTPWAWADSPAESVMVAC